MLVEESVWVCGCVCETGGEEGGRRSVGRGGDRELVLNFVFKMSSFPLEAIRMVNHNRSVS